MGQVNTRWSYASHGNQTGKCRGVYRPKMGTIKRWCCGTKRVGEGPSGSWWAALVQALDCVCFVMLVLGQCHSSASASLISSAGVPQVYLPPAPPFLGLSLMEWPFAAEGRGRCGDSSEGKSSRDEAAHSLPCTSRCRCLAFGLPAGYRG